MKSTSAINLAIKNMEYLIVKVCASCINSVVGVLLDHGVSLCFVLLLALQTHWVTFQAKDNARSTPASWLSTYPSLAPKP